MSLRSMCNTIALQYTKRETLILSEIYRYLQSNQILFVLKYNETSNIMLFKSWTAK